MFVYFLVISSHLIALDSQRPTLPAFLFIVGTKLPPPSATPSTPASSPPFHTHSLHHHRPRRRLRQTTFPFCNIFDIIFGANQHNSLLNDPLNLHHHWCRRPRQTPQPHILYLSVFVVLGATLAFVVFSPHRVQQPGLCLRQPAVTPAACTTLATLVLRAGRPLCRAAPSTSRSSVPDDHHGLKYLQLVS